MPRWSRGRWHLEGSPKLRVGYQSPCLCNSQPFAQHMFEALDEVSRAITASIRPQMTYIVSPPRGRD